MELSDDNDLLSSINHSKSDKYKVIKDYIFELLKDKQISLSDGIIAKVDNRDVTHIAHNASNKKIAEISQLENIIKKAVFVSEAINVAHNKFDSFRYYGVKINYHNEGFVVYLNVGRSKYDGDYHIWDITDKKEGSVANRLYGLSRPVGNAITNNTSKHSIPNSSENVKLGNRLSGDELLNAQELVDEIESVGGDVDEYGYVTVYHRTTENAKQKILSTGKMSAKEDGIFFSTKRDGQAEGYGDAVVEMRIPVENLVLDDIFDDEAHLRYPLENRNATLDVSEYIDNSKNVQFSVGSVDTYTEKQYNDYGWIVVNDILNGKEFKQLYSQFANIKLLKHKYPKTPNGENIIVTGEKYGTIDSIVFI